MAGSGRRLSSDLGEDVVERGIDSFETRMPFNRLLGLRIEEATLEGVRIGFEKKPEHVGNFVRQTLHGGVISSVLDTTGGLVAFVHAAHRLEGEPEDIQRRTLERIGTIDLRVDFLVAAEGERFYATGRSMRAGGRVAVARMELHDAADDQLVAVGTGTYIIG